MKSVGTSLRWGHIIRVFVQTDTARISICKRIVWANLKRGSSSLNFCLGRYIAWRRSIKNPSVRWYKQLLSRPSYRWKRNLTINPLRGSSTTNGLTLHRPAWRSNGVSQGVPVRSPKFRRNFICVQLLNKSWSANGTGEVRHHDCRNTRVALATKQHSARYPCHSVRQSKSNSTIIYKLYNFEASLSAFLDNFSLS